MRAWMMSFETVGSTWVVPSEVWPWKATVAPAGIGTSGLRSDVMTGGEQAAAVTSPATASRRSCAAETTADMGGPRMG